MRREECRTGQFEVVVSSGYRAFPTGECVHGVTFRMPRARCQPGWVPFADRRYVTDGRSEKDRW